MDVYLSAEVDDGTGCGNIDQINSLLVLSGGSGTTYNLTGDPYALALPWANGSGLSTTGSHNLSKVIVASTCAGVPAGTLCSGTVPIDGTEVFNPNCSSPSISTFTPDAPGCGTCGFYCGLPACPGGPCILNPWIIVDYTVDLNGDLHIDIRNP